MKTKKILLLLLLILILGTSLRFFHLNQEALWTDESVTLMHTETRSLNNLINSVITKELMPPGHTITLYYWIKYFGNSEFALRSLSVLFDIGSIFLVFLIGSRIFNRKIGLLASLITSITMLQIVYAQEARPYAMLGFFVLLSSYLFILHYQEKKNTYLIPYAITSLLAIYSGYMAIFILCFHFLFLLFQGRFTKKYFLSLLAIVMGYIMGYQILYYQVALRHPSLQKNLILRGVPEFLSNLGILFYLLPILFLSLFTIIIYFSFKKIKINTQTTATLIITMTSLAAILHIIFLPITMRSFALIRHTFLIVPFLYILIAWAILQKSKKVQTIFMFCLIIFSIFTLTTYYTTTTKAPWPEALSFMQENSPQNTLALFDRSGSNNHLFNYYGGGYFKMVNLEHKGIMIPTNQIQEITKNQKSFWLVSSRNIKNKNVKLFLDKDLIIKKEYPELTLYLYS